MASPWSDFTDAAYRRLLLDVAKGYRFARFGEDVAGAHVLWRHDVDRSVHRALAMARLEAEVGAKSTFFLRFHSGFYNLLYGEVAGRVRQIRDLGHEIGLHFECGAYEGLDDHEKLERAVAKEASWLEDVVGAPVRAFSFHDPGVAGVLDMDDETIAGLINVYARSIRSAYAYCSDSNGYWRHARLFDEIDPATKPRLHVLIHPEWWTPEALPPRDRVLRCAHGLAEHLVRIYDANPRTRDARSSGHDV